MRSLGVLERRRIEPAARSLPFSAETPESWYSRMPKPEIQDDSKPCLYLITVEIQPSVQGEREPLYFMVQGFGLG